MAIRAGVLTISDGVSTGHREDTSGRTTEEAVGRVESRVVERAVVPDERHRIVERLLAWCDAGVELILTTGGTGALYAVTTNPAEARGQGLAMAARAGAEIADPEFVQFHPTAIAADKDPAPLVTEALRGAGAVLTDAAGQRFTDELAPRDQVARAIGALGEIGGKGKAVGIVGHDGVLSENGWGASGARGRRRHPDTPIGSVLPTRAGGLSPCMCRHDTMMTIIRDDPPPLFLTALFL